MLYRQKYIFKFLIKMVRFMEASQNQGFLYLSLLFRLNNNITIYLLTRLLDLRYNIMTANIRCITC